MQIYISLICFTHRRKIVSPIEFLKVGLGIQKSYSFIVSLRLLLKVNSAEDERIFSQPVFLFFKFKSCVHFLALNSNIFFFSDFFITSNI